MFVGIVQERALSLLYQPLFLNQHRKNPDAENFRSFTESSHERKVIPDNTKQCTCRDVHRAWDAIKIKLTSTDYTEDQI